MRELKRKLRKELITKRQQMPLDEKAVFDNDIFAQLKPLVESASLVLTYASTEIEVDTRRLIKYCLERNIPVALPVSGDTELTFYHIKSLNDLSKGRYNIDEPKTDIIAVADENALCVVPALCADGNGYRLGYGKGYYDRFLSDFTGKSVIICYNSFRMEVPTEEHDKKADLTIFNRI